MTDLSQYQKVNVNSSEGVLKSMLWYIVNHLIFNHHFLPLYGIKKMILVAFGAKIGKGFVIKPAVNIKFPWKLEIGDDVWLGEKVWIDNLAMVKIGNNVCISQGAMLLTGNHDYKSKAFDLILKPILIEDGVWIGAQSTIAPGVTCKVHSVLTVGSVLTSDMDSHSIYQGNPAVKKKERTFNS